jgi:hypothetical protein
MLAQKLFTILCASFIMLLLPSGDGITGRRIHIHVNNRINNKLMKLSIIGMLLRLPPPRSRVVEVPVTIRQANLSQILRRTASHLSAPNANPL